MVCPFHHPQHQLACAGKPKKKKVVGFSNPCAHPSGPSPERLLYDGAKCFIIIIYLKHSIAQRVYVLG